MTFAASAVVGDDCGPGAGWASAEGRLERGDLVTCEVRAWHVHPGAGLGGLAQIAFEWEQIILAYCQAPFSHPFASLAGGMQRRSSSQRRHRCPEQAQTFVGGRSRPPRRPRRR